MKRVERKVVKQRQITSKREEIGIKVDATCEPFPESVVI